VLYASGRIGDLDRAFTLLRRTVARREPLVTEISVPCDDGFARCATMRGSAN
jgi:hypothetical protein